MARSSRKLAALVGIVAIPAAVACNGILGISDYEKGDCTGGCVDGSTTFDVFQPDASKQDSSTPTVPDAGRGTQPVRWAKFQMPNYPDGDAGPTSPVATYATNTATVTIEDSVTRLQWRSMIELKGPKTYDEAEAHCKGLPGGWRLPSRIELVTLLDLARSPTIAAAFTGTEKIEYWTSSEVRPLTRDRQHWTVDFNAGGLKQQGTVDDGSGVGYAGVRCIKDASK